MRSQSPNSSNLVTQSELPWGLVFFFQVFLFFVCGCCLLLFAFGVAFFVFFSWCSFGALGCLFCPPLVEGLWGVAPGSRVRLFWFLSLFVFPVRLRRRGGLGLCLGFPFPLFLCVALVCLGRSLCAFPAASAAWLACPSPAGHPVGPAAQDTASWLDQKPK